jgi:hypothetical protein
VFVSTRTSGDWTPVEPRGAADEVEILLPLRRFVIVAEGNLLALYTDSPSRGGIRVAAVDMQDGGDLMKSSRFEEPALERISEAS